MSCTQSSKESVVCTHLRDSHWRTSIWGQNHEWPWCQESTEALEIKDQFDGKGYLLSHLHCPCSWFGFVIFIQRRYFILHFHVNDRVELMRRCGEFMSCNWNISSSSFPPGLQDCFCIFLTYKCTPNLHSQCFYSSRNTFLPSQEGNKTSFKGLISMHLGHKIQEGSDPLPMSQTQLVLRVQAFAICGTGKERNALCPLFRKQVATELTDERSCFKLLTG